MSDPDVVDSPTSWVADHIQRYVESDGTDGHDWRGVPTLLITTKGRKSGVLRRSALIYGADGDRLILVASKGGADAHPLWYLNLQADPAVAIQVGADKFTAQARTANADERAALWPTMTAIWPDYDSYQAKTDREIPVVIVERTG
jgi:deazaflavin-dependent oxidoreductase (nitroreductase family)